MFVRCTFGWIGNDEFIYSVLDSKIQKSWFSWWSKYSEVHWSTFQITSNIDQQAKGKKDGEIRYLTPLNIETNKQKKYCRFKKSGIKYIDYKDPDFLMKFVNEQGKILPRRLTGTSLKYQRKVAVAVKRARHLALMPYVGDLLK